ncbi:MAG: glutamate-cysteine ligase family protein [Peptoniphilaceae bacterium]|nr:glutamate-cysteine ligase family protein [Peptoniphilaceae bacterium]
MSLFHSEQEKLNQICQYLRKGFTPRTQWAVGIELEHLLVDASTMKRVFYDGERGVAEVLQRLLVELSATPIYEKDALLGMSTREFELSIEPGGQFEISLAKEPSLLTLRDHYFHALTQIHHVLDPMRLTLLPIGLDPWNTIEEIPLIPKERYHIMDQTMGNISEAARAMMRQTCALQISIDVENEKDWIRKFRVLFALSPILYTLFDSIALQNGSSPAKYNVRQEIWRKTDPVRTGVVPGIFRTDFSLEDYAKWLLNIPVLFLPADDGIHHEEKSFSLSEALDEAKTAGQADDFIMHGISVTFPDVRYKQFLEVRMMDSLPDPWAFAAAAMLRGLFYDDDVFAELEALFTPFQSEWIPRGKDAGRDNGIQGYYHSDYFVNWGLRLLKMAERGLCEEEKDLLKPLQKLWSNLDTPRIYIERMAKQQGWTAAFASLTEGKKHA